ncbi:hypothetical protein E2C01_052812 [Portunus trituberculatus]|uniref:Uncharacterized protein n=1 Tax=Portunus trituberculatus TaxID=210409 RepID=A0A5B7GMQ8_PORTR|nr:hypothetical protein [Portunus trituberculatus]
MASASSDIGGTRHTCVNSEALCTHPSSRSTNWFSFPQQGHLYQVKEEPARQGEKNCDDAHELQEGTADDAERHGGRHLAIHDTQQGSIPIGRVRAAWRTPAGSIGPWQGHPAADTLTCRRCCCAAHGAGNAAKFVASCMAVVAEAVQLETVSGTFVLSTDYLKAKTMATD